MKLIIGVEVFQGIVNDIHVFPDTQRAAEWFKSYTGVDWYEKLAGDKDLSDNFDQTKLFEVEVNGFSGRKYINNLRISFSKRDGVFRVVTPDGRWLEEFQHRRDAEDFARRTLDFRRRRTECSTLK